MKVVVEKIAIDWDEISPVMIRQSWRKLYPLEPHDVEESLDDEQNNSEFLNDFRSLGEDLVETDVAEWIESDSQDLGYEHLDDDAIVDLVLGQDQEGVTQPDSDDDVETAYNTTSSITITKMPWRCLINV